MTIEIIGHAVVSADGRIADREHRTPAALRNEADWRRFQAALDRAALVVLGRIGHEAHPNRGRRRLVATSRVDGLTGDPRDARSVFWNPARMEFSTVLRELGIDDGTIAVTGGTRVFDLFLPLFTGFELVEMAGVTIPDGVPCFSDGPPGEMLVKAGLDVAQTQELDAGVRLEIWRTYFSASG